MGEFKMKRVKRGYILSVGIILVMLLSISFPVVAKTNIKDFYRGYDKGVSWKSVVPVRKVR